MPLPGSIITAASVIPMAVAGSGKKKTDPVGPSAVDTVAPVNLTAPVVTGTNYYLNTLSTTNGTWDSIATPTYTYQWQRGGSDIGGATASTYQCVEADEGQDITCIVTATNPIGSTPQVSNTINSWLPTALTLRLWLCASRPSTVNTGSPSSNDAIQDLDDLSPNAVTYSQGTSSKRPTWVASVLDSKPVFRFSAANQQNLKESTINTVNRSAAHTIVIVSKLSSFDQAYKYMMGFKGATSNPSFALSTNAGFLDAFWGDDTSVDSWNVCRLTTVSNTTSWHVYILTYNGSNATVLNNFAFYDKSTLLTKTDVAGNDGVNQNTFGSYKDSVIYNWNGDIAEIFVANGEADSTLRSTILAYVAARYPTLA